MGSTFLERNTVNKEKVLRKIGEGEIREKLPRNDLINDVIEKDCSDLGCDNSSF